MWVSFDDCEIRNKGDLNNRNILLNIDKSDSICRNAVIIGHIDNLKMLYKLI